LIYQLPPECRTLHTGYQKPLPDDNSYKSSAVAEMGGDRLGTTDMGQKVGGLLCPFHGGAVSTSNTMSPGPRPTTVPSGILINPAVWPQYTNVTHRQDRCGPVAQGKPLLAMVTKIKQIKFKLCNGNQQHILLRTINVPQKVS